MTIPPVEKREKELYPLVTRLLEEQGLRVWEEATIRAGDKEPGRQITSPGAGMAPRSRPALWK
jgi:hypothetical protein